MKAPSTSGHDTSCSDTPTSRRATSSTMKSDRWLTRVVTVRGPTAPGAGRSCPGGSGPRPRPVGDRALAQHAQGPGGDERQEVSDPRREVVTPQHEGEHTHGQGEDQHAGEGGSDEAGPGLVGDGEDGEGDDGHAQLHEGVPHP